jgi:hypothetical protein
MDESYDLDEVHGLLVQLCEQDEDASDETQLCVMEAFNVLSELHPPTRISPPSAQRAFDRFARALDLLDRLVQRSQRLDRTLALIRVHGLVAQALEAQR